MVIPIAIHDRVTFTVVPYHIQEEQYNKQNSRSEPESLEHFTDDETTKLLRSQVSKSSWYLIYPYTHIKTVASIVMRMLVATIGKRQ